MDLTSSWVLLFVVLLGGGIALYADRLGRNLGKKRLKLGSLRPRKTAEIIVFLAGMLTPLIAILAIMAVSAEARLWIIRGYKAVQDARNAVTAKDNALKELERTQGRIRDLGYELKDLQERLNSARKKSDIYVAQATGARQRAEKANANAARLGASVNRLSNEVKGRQVALNRVQGDLSRASKTLADIRLSYRTLQQKTDEANDKVLELDAEIDTLNAKLATGQGELDKVRTDLNHKQKELKDAEEAQARAKEQFQRELEQIGVELKAAEQSLAITRNQMRFLTEKSLTERLIFQTGEELTRLPVHRQMNRMEADRALETVLLYARIAAKDRGAEAGPEGTEAGLLEYTENGVRVTAAQQAAELAKGLTGAPNERIIVVRALFNSFGRQFVPITVDVYPNPIVFQEGELLGEGRIDNDLAVGRMIETIGDILRDQVRRKAEERRMIAVSGREDAYGSVSADEIYAVVTQIQNYGRPVRLQVLAKQDTRAGGPLALEFRLK